MAQKIYDQQGNIYYIKGPVNSGSEDPAPMLNKQAIRQLATIIGQSFNIQLYEQQLVFLLGYKDCNNNLEAIIAWLSEQDIQEPGSSIEFQDLYDNLVFRLSDVTNGFSSI